MVARSPAIQRFAAAPRRALVFDFDGTLSEIVARPELARPVDGAIDALSRLSKSSALVAVVSGRPARELRALIEDPGVTVVGLYGLSEAGPERTTVARARGEVERAAGMVPGAWVEDKGPSLVVHYRAAADGAGAEAVLTPELRRIARELGLSMLVAKKAIELAGGPVPGKGTVVRDLVGSGAVSGCLYAGDDVADMDAFEELGRLEAEGVAIVRVAVRSEETPGRLLDAADLVVERPAGLVALLSEL